MYQDILVPVDGSTPSLEALDEAAEMAARWDATIHLLFVVDVTMLGDVSDPSILDSIENSGEQAVERAVSRARDAGVTEVEHSTSHGTPHRRILEYVEDNDVDLVIMGTHGRTGLNRLLLGSVTEKIVRLSPVPVLTIRPGAEPPEETAAEE